MLAILIIFALITILWIWSMCITASKADRQNTEIDSEVYRRKDNGKTNA